MSLDINLTGVEITSNKKTTLTDNSDTFYPTQKAVKTAVDLKVDAVAGKGLSANDFTNTLKTKLDGIEAGAEVNVNADWNAVSGDAQILNKPTIPSIAGLATETFVTNITDNKVDKVTGSRLITSAESTVLGNTSGTNTGDQDLTNLVVKNSAITGATKTKITYDAKGLVTAGADATTADIADSSNKRYVTDANLTVIGNTSNTNTGDETQSSILSKLGWFKTTVTTNYAVTGTTGETLITPSTQLPTLSNGTIFKINALRISKGALSGTTIRAYLSPNSNNLSGAVQILSTGSTIVLGTRLATISRVFEIEGGNIKGLNATTGVLNDNGTSSTVVGLDAALPAGTLYLIVTVTNSLTTETTTQELLDISNF